MAIPDIFDQACPLRGAVLCCTSIPPEKRTELAERAGEMGAKHVYDLTSDVTHLIVGEYNTPKYRFVARERPDVQIINPDWVDAVRSLWIADQKIDMEALEREHTLATFATLKICVTGFEDHDERGRLMRLVQAHGAEYHGNLTRDVTHLLASRTGGKKYTHAKQWGLQIVSTEWLYDSIQRGMILDEKLYDLELPVEERGKGAWIRKKVPARKRARTDEVAEEGRCKLRRTTSMKLNNESQKIWGDIMTSGTTAVNEQAHPAEWEEPSKPKDASEQPDTTPVEETKPRESIFKKAQLSKPRALFTDRRFYLHGFSDQKMKRLKEFLLSHDAQLIPTLDVFEREDKTDIKNSYIIIPHDLAVSDRLEVPDSLSKIPIITEFWVERCYEMKEIQDPATYTLGRPFPKFPIPRFSGMIISSTAFTGLELLHVSKAVELLGAKYDEYLTPKHSVLICASSKFMTRAKFDHAQEWKLPVVSSQWLWDSIEKGEKQPFQKYLYRAKKNSTSRPVSRSSSINIKPGNSSDIADAAPLDDDEDTTIEIKAEEESPRLDEEPPDPSTKESSKPPLGETSGNATASNLTPPVPSAPTPIDVPREDIDNAINTLLAKAKSSSNPSTSDPTDNKKKRSQPRILGRAASNMSATSVASLESSVDIQGSAVQWPSKDPLTKDSIVDKRLSTIDSESQAPPSQQTQPEWEEEESAEHRQKLVAAIHGNSEVKKSRGGKQRAVTLGDLNETPRQSRSGLKGLRGLRGRTRR